MKFSQLSNVLEIIFTPLDVAVALNFKYLIMCVCVCVCVWGQPEYTTQRLTGTRVTMGT